MPDIRYDRNHHAGGTEEARLNSRLENSGKGADTVVKHGTGARRTFHNIHHSAGHLKPRDVRKDNTR
jgi:hypothetical protein